MSVGPWTSYGGISWTRWTRSKLPCEDEDEFSNKTGDKVMLTGGRSRGQLICVVFGRMVKMIIGKFGLARPP